MQPHYFSIVSKTLLGQIWSKALLLAMIMLATTLTQNDVDRLSDALFHGLKLVKPKIDQLA